MFDTNYYCLVAGLREYSLDGGAKGFDPHAILDEILRELTPRDLRAVRLLYGYYDCKNLIALRAGSPAHDPLGNLERFRPHAAQRRGGHDGPCRGASRRRARRG